MTTAEALRQRLRLCPPGAAGWKEFEEISRDILEHVLCPPLGRAKPRPSRHCGIDRRDVAFPNWVRDLNTNWGRLYERLEAQLVLASFTNHDHGDLDDGEVVHTGKLLNAPMGNLALLVTRGLPGAQANVTRNTIFAESGKVILFLTTDHLTEMLYMKERDEDPADLIIDLLDYFYLRWRQP